MTKTQIQVPEGLFAEIKALRTALCLQAFGVTDFATANVKDFEDAGFSRVWNPVTPSTTP